MVKRSSSSGKKKPAKRNYASKVVGKIIDEVTAAKLNGTKNPTAMAKWMQKMKLSLLRKISLSSKSLFGDQNVDLLTEEIDDLRKEIRSKTKRITALVNDRRRESTLADLPIVIPLDEQSYQTGQFEDKAEAVKQQFIDVAAQLNLVTKEITSSISQLGNNVIAMEPLVNSKYKVAKSPPSSSSKPESRSTSGSKSSSSSSSSSKKLKSGKGTRSYWSEGNERDKDKDKDKDPIVRVAGHLSKN